MRSPQGAGGPGGAAPRLRGVRGAQPTVFIYTYIYIYTYIRVYVGPLLKLGGALLSMGTSMFPLSDKNSSVARQVLIQDPLCAAVVATRLQCLTIEPFLSTLA